MKFKVLSLLCCLVTGTFQAHLLPQALEDVHSYVQKELSQRSQGALGVEAPPIAAGGRTFSTTQTFFGTPVVIQKEMRLDGKGGIQLPGFPIHSDLKTAASTSLAHAIQAQLPPVPPAPPAPPAPQSPMITGLVPPVPLALNPGDQAVQASSHGPPAIIPANLVGPSQFLSGIPPPPPPPPPSGARGPPPPPRQYQQPQYQPPQSPQYRQPPPPPPPPSPQYQPPSPQYQPPPPQYQPPRQNQPPHQQQAIRQIPPPQFQPSPQRQPPSPQYQQPQQQSNQDDKQMQGWVPLDNEGSKLAKGVGIKVQVDDDLRQNQNQNLNHYTAQVIEIPSPSASPNHQNDRKPDYENVAYSIQNQEDEQQNSNGNTVRNELEIVQTNNLRLGENEVVDDIIIKKLTNNKGNSGQGRGRHPVYPKDNGKSTPKVVIHAQNVIIRGGPNGGIEEIQAINDTTGQERPSSGISQYPAYANNLQVTSFLRDQLRNMAMQHLMQAAMEEHPLNRQQFPRPLSLRELAAAVRNGEFPQPTRDQILGGGQLPSQDPMSPQPSMLTPTQMQFSVPHTVQMNPNVQLPLFDPLTLPSISSPQHKVVLPGNLGNLYKNLVQQEAIGGGGSLFDPTQPLDLSALQALQGQRSKGQRPVTGDYGDSVKYTTDKKNKENEQNKSPIQILEAQPQLGLIVKQHQNIHHHQTQGNLKDVSDQLLKQLLIQELQDVDSDQPPQQQQVLLPVGLGPQLHIQQRPLRLVKRPAYGTNAHPFAFLAEDGSVSEEPHVFEETIEYTLPPGANIEDYLSGDGGSSHSHGLKKRPRGPPRHRPGGHHGYGGADEDDDIFGDLDGGYGHGGQEHGGHSDGMPLNGETMKQLGKGLLSSALQFSRNHNPLTFLQRIRSLPPVKVDLYKVPVGIPQSLIEKMPKEFSFGSGPEASGSSHYGRPPSKSGGRGHGRRQRKKNSPRKNNKHY